MNHLKKYTILVVEDEVELRDLIVQSFRMLGFNTLLAEHGVKALEIVKDTKVDVVISDMRMPNGDGFSFLESVRALDPEFPYVIFVTGYADVMEAECLAKGAYKVLSKPFDQKILIDSVFSALKITRERAAG